MTKKGSNTDSGSVNLLHVARYQASHGCGAMIVCSDHHEERPTGYVVAWSDDKSQAWIVGASDGANAGSFGRAYRGLPKRDRIACQSCGRRLDLGHNELRARLAATVAASELEKVQLISLIRLAASKS